MKKLLSLLFFFMFITIYSQNMRDVVHLKNGSIIKGIITEMNPNGNIKIQTSDGSIFVYKTSDVIKTVKEQIPNNTNSLQKSTNSIISQKSLNDFFVNYLSQKRPALNFVGVSKVNGIQKEVFGQKIYEVEYELLMESKQDIYINASQFGSAWSARFVDNFAYSGRPSGKYEATLAGSKKKIEKGKRILTTGTLFFEKTDNGWRSKSFKNKTYKIVASNYVSKNMQKEIAINNEKNRQLQLIEREKKKKEEAERTAKLRKSLDWKKSDIENIELKTMYYDIYDVPYFNQSNAKYRIRKSTTNAIRNDVISTIQKSIFSGISQTDRMNKSTKEKYSEADNKATYIFNIEKVDFKFIYDGYQCYIDLKVIVLGNYKDPKELKVNYTVPIIARSNPITGRLSKQNSLENASKRLQLKIAEFIYKYEPVQFNVVDIETDKKGKPINVLFKRTQNIRRKKVKFLVLPTSGLSIKDKKFSISSKIAECTYKGETTSSEIKCKISGRKNRKAFEKVINNSSTLISISM